MALRFGRTRAASSAPAEERHSAAIKSNQRMRLIPAASLHSIQAVLAEPVFDVLGDYVVVHLLEHEVAVPGNALVRQVDHGAVAAVGIVEMCIRDRYSIDEKT